MLQSTASFKSDIAKLPNYYRCVITTYNCTVDYYALIYTCYFQILWIALYEKDDQYILHKKLLHRNFGS